jgi:two-component system, OmpR family, copper resistance phosphate regulon response regulator CusR
VNEGLDTVNILVVEDELNMANFLRRGLKEEGYTVDVVGDGVEGAVQAAVRDYDMIVLDVMLPRLDGLGVTARIRREGNSTPILLLTARDDPEDIVRGLNAGADDYLTKPFRFDVLLARLRALTRRGAVLRMDVLQFGDIQLDRLAHEAHRGPRRLNLTPKEFKLLEYFLLNPGRVVRRTELLEKVWEMLFEPGTNVVNVHVANLRSNLEATGESRVIQTVRGVGYVLREADPGEER